MHEIRSSTSFTCKRHSITSSSSSSSSNFNTYVIIFITVLLLIFVNNVHTVDAGFMELYKGRRHYSKKVLQNSPKLQQYTSKHWHAELPYKMKSGRSGTDSLKPYFDESTNRNVTATTLKPAYLHCRVRNLGGRTVSWIRKKDLHILTVGPFAYTKDDRYSTMHMENSDDWTLEIRYPEKKDEGIYECQVSTVPKMSLKVRLNVVETKAEIIGGSSIYVNSGSNIRLECIVKDSPIGGANYVFWHHNDETIEYDSARNTVELHEDKTTTSSVLLIRNAKSSDIGNYSCNPSNASPATIYVHVINGGNQAAIQDVNQNSSENSPRTGGGVQMLYTASLLILELFFMSAAR